MASAIQPIASCDMLAICLPVKDTLVPVDLSVKAKLEHQRGQSRMKVQLFEFALGSALAILVAEIFKRKSTQICTSRLQ